MTSKLVLYYSPGACSQCAHIALLEWGVDFEGRPVSLATGEHRSPEYLAINPRSRVPFMLIDGKPAGELSGLLTWIGQQGGLYPPIGTYEAAKCAEWLAWMTSAVHVAVAMVWRGERFALNERDYPAVKERGLIWLHQQFSEIEAVLSKSPYAMGDAYSIVDCNIFPFYRWGNRIGFDMKAEFPAWTAYTKTLSQRPAVKAALAKEAIDPMQAPEPGTPRVVSLRT